MEPTSPTTKTRPKPMFSTKRHGMVRFYIHEVDRIDKPWVQRLGGKTTTKKLAFRIRKWIAGKLGFHAYQLTIALYRDGLIFLDPEGYRVIWDTKRRGKGEWGKGEKMNIEHYEMYGVDDSSYEN